MSGKDGSTSMDFFSQFSTIEKKILEKLFVEERFQKGETILRQGQNGDRLYVVASGAVEVVSLLPGNYMSRLAEMGRGNFFGEVSLLTEQQATATVVAAEEVVCKTLQMNALDLILHLNPTLYDKCKKYIAEICCKRVKKILLDIAALVERVEELEPQVASHFFSREDAIVEQRKGHLVDTADVGDHYLFSAFSEKELSAFLSMGRSYFCEEGYDFALHPIESNDFFLVLSGAAQLNSARNIKVTIVPPGKIFNHLREIDPTIPLYPIVRESGIFLYFDSTLSERLKESDLNLWRLYRDIHYRETAASLQSVASLLRRLQAEEKLLQRVKKRDV